MRTFYQACCVVLFSAFAYLAGHIDGKRAALEPKVSVEGDARVMRVGDIGVQSITMLDGGHTGSYYDWAALVSVFAPPEPRVVMLGLGGGEMLRVLKRSSPGAYLEAVEVDERVITLALRDFPDNVSDVVVMNADAARWASRCFSPQYDAVIVDVYAGPEMPEHFQGAQFYRDVARCLLPRGMVIVNAKDRALAKTLAAALREAGFADVVAFPVVPTPNVILWAVEHDDWGAVKAPPELQAGFDLRYNP